MHSRPKVCGRPIRGSSPCCFRGAVITRPSRMSKGMLLSEDDFRNDGIKSFFSKEKQCNVP